MHRANAEDEENRLATMPPFLIANGLTDAKPGATVLASLSDEAGRTFTGLAAQRFGPGRVAAVAVGDLWRWGLQDAGSQADLARFWRQLSRNLVANSPRPFELTATVENQNIVVRAELRDPEDEDNQNLSISAVVSSDSNEVVNLDLLPVAGQAGIYQASFRPAGEGLYSVEAISRQGEELKSSVRTATRFDQGQEAFNIRQNRDLLERLSQATGGAYWTPAQWGEVSDAISFSTAGITEQQISYLWDAPLFFLLLLILKTCEWLLRRRWRVI